MANTWTAELRQHRRVPVVNEPDPSLVDQFGTAEPFVRQMGSALGVIAMDEPIADFLAEHDPKALEQVRAAFRRYLEVVNDHEFATNPFANCSEHGDPLVLIAGRLAAIRGTTVMPLPPTVRWFRGTIHQESDGRHREVLAAVATTAFDGKTVVVAGSYGDTEQDADEVSITVLVGRDAERFAVEPKWGGGFWTSAPLHEVGFIRTVWGS